MSVFDRNALLIHTFIEENLRKALTLI